MEGDERRGRLGKKFGKSGVKWEKKKSAKLSPTSKSLPSAWKKKFSNGSFLYAGGSFLYI
jgi:hypothetical protein